ATRGEFYSAYTPYQAEASQGTLQLIYEYQSMMTALTGLDVSNASLYDGASGLAEAVLMTVRAHKSKGRRVLIPRSVHPYYRQTARNIVRTQGIEMVEIDFDHKTGRVETAQLPADSGAAVALVIPQPNFFGTLEEVDQLTDWAHARGLYVIAVVNPLTLALLKPPGEWGGKGADIACGDGQPLGIPMSSGGPYYGFMCCKQELVRQMPGRIVGRTVDLDGKPGFTLTLQAREQHIRRSKATSNICTNQGLMVTASTIYMALMGPQGLARTAEHCIANTQTLRNELRSVAAPIFSGPVFHETVVTLRKPAAEVIERLAAQHIVGGVDLSVDYPELGNALLVCATETKTAADISTYARALATAQA
ncbi:MAG: aminomethyl-transferring glycine dehydrogenase subunit GcvPA, partial [Gammaproteobacteria bacterium]|nr:aminomethyl-transferring glycine dehydrogenase subunit GcvPA [Gammaproteobacteria bacterium]